MIDRKEIDIRYELACNAAREAGYIAKRYFRTSPEVVKKADNSPVTIADREGEKRIRGIIQRLFPDDAILGEEFGEVPGTNKFRWTIDPIDGTKSFVCGVPLFGTLVGVEYEGRSIAGVIYLPMFDELLTAVEGRGAHCNGEPIRLSETANLNQAVVVGSGVEYQNDAWARAFSKILPQIRYYRTWGDCYGWTLLLQGHVDVVFDPGLKPWDRGPLEILVKEAGGEFHYQLASDTDDIVNCLGANPALMEQIRAHFD